MLSFSKNNGRIDNDTTQEMAVIAIHAEPAPDRIEKPPATAKAGFVGSPVNWRDADVDVIK